MTTHRRRLAWYTVPVDRTGLADRPGAERAAFLLGDPAMRCSADLGTGAAGALLALAEQVADPLAAVLRLPAVVRTDAAHG